MALADDLETMNRDLARRLKIRTTPPSSTSALNQVFRARVNSRLGVSVLGTDSLGNPATLSGEERKTHVEIIGSPGQGKSKLLELLVRDGIRNGHFQCLLDPGDSGDTARRLLEYCCKTGFERVIYINPADFGAAVPSFNPIKYRAPVEVAVGNVLDAMSVLWMSDFSDKVGFRKYAEVLLNVLHRSKYTLSDAEYFLNPKFVRQRNQILSEIPDDIYKAELQKSFRGGVSFEAVVNRFLVFSDSRLKLLLGPRKGISFRKLIKDGWLVLVNLDPQSVWGTQQLQQRLLGTLVINEIVHALHNLREYENFSRPCYLYIDEVGDYATPKLAFILDKKRKAGLSLTLAHQRFGQILDKNVLSAIRTSTSTKFLFHTPDQSDRQTMMKDMGYGGEIPDRELVWNLRQLKVGQAAVVIGKPSPRYVDIREIPDVRNHPGTLKAYIRKLYSSEFYKTPQEINQELSARFNQVREPGVPHAGRPSGGGQEVAFGAAADDGRANRKARLRTEERRRFKSVFTEEED